MHIQLDSPTQNSITSYTETSLRIHDVSYQDNVVVSRDKVISPWAVSSFQALTKEILAPILQQGPEIILIGHAHLGLQAPIEIQRYLSKQRIGFECMYIGPACRTFNLLLSEGRRIVAGFIF